MKSTDIKKLAGLPIEDELDEAVDMKDRFNVPRKHGKNWDEQDKENWRRWVRNVGRRNKVGKSKTEYFIDWVYDWDESFHVFTTEAKVMDEINALERSGMFDGIDGLGIFINR